MTWREIEAAFDHLFDVSLVDSEAQRIVLRFRRARSQILPVFSSMVVSPYERERTIALTLLAGIGGSATVKMLDEVIADIDIHAAYKLDLRLLRDKLEPERGVEPDEDELDEEAEPRPASRRGRGRDEATEESTDEAAEVVTEAEEEDDASARAARRAGRGRRGRRGRAPRPAETTAPAETADTTAAPGPAVDLSVFESQTSARFLAALEEPAGPLLAAFDELPMPKKLSFIDRAGRVDDAKVLSFLVPLLASSEQAVVQSALRALAEVGRPEALPEVERLAAVAGRSRVKMRAERVAEHLRSLAGQPPAAAAPEEPAEEAPPRRPKPLRRGRGGQRGGQGETPAEAAEAGPAADAEPLATPPSEGDATAPEGPAPRPRRSSTRRDRDDEGEALRADEVGLLPPLELTVEAAEPLVLATRPGKVQTCQASGWDVHGRQRLWVWRQGEEKGLDGLELLIHASQGWLGVRLHRGLPVGTPKAQAAGLVEVTVGYVRRQVVEAVERGRTAGIEPPPDSEAALTFIGTGRKAEVAAELPEDPRRLGQDEIEQLLDHPLLAGWCVGLRSDGVAVQRWQATAGKRSASRVRRRLIDDVARGWLERQDGAQLVVLLQYQAVLLERGGASELAAIAAICAAQVAGGQRLDQHLLLREMIYRGFQSALDQAPRPAPRRRSGPRPAGHSEAGEARRRHGRSAFRLGRRSVSRRRRPPRN